MLTQQLRIALVDVERALQDVHTITVEVNTQESGCSTSASSSSATHWLGLGGLTESEKERMSDYRVGLRSSYSELSIASMNYPRTPATEVPTAVLTDIRTATADSSGSVHSCVSPDVLRGSKTEFVSGSASTSTVSVQNTRGSWLTNTDSGEADSVDSVEPPKDPDCPIVQVFPNAGVIAKTLTGPASSSTLQTPYKTPIPLAGGGSNSNSNSNSNSSSSSSNGLTRVVSVTAGDNTSCGGGSSSGTGTGSGSGSCSCSDGDGDGDCDSDGVAFMNQSGIKSSGPNSGMNSGIKPRSIASAFRHALFGSASRPADRHFLSTDLVLAQYYLSTNSVPPQY